MKVCESASYSVSAASSSSGTMFEDGRVWAIASSLCYAWQLCFFGTPQVAWLCDYTLE